MKQETKDLLMIQGMARVAENLASQIDEGNVSLEENILKSGKSLTDCWKYIEQKARKLAVNGCACIEDNTVYEWAKKFYDEKGEPDDMEKPAKIEKKEEKPKLEKTEGRKKRKTKTSKDDSEISQKIENLKIELIEEAALENEKKSDGVSENLKSDETKEIGASIAETVEVSSKEDFSAIPEKDKESEICETVDGYDEAVRGGYIKEDSEAGSLKESLDLPSEQLEMYSEASENIDIPASEMKCVICGKRMCDAYPDRTASTLEKWAKTWISRYNQVFCSKQHMDEFLKR